MSNVIIDETTDIEQYRSFFEEVINKLGEEWTVVVSYPRRDKFEDETEEEYEDYMSSTIWVQFITPRVEGKGRAKLHLTLNREILESSIVDSIVRMANENFEYQKKQPLILDGKVIHA